MKNFKKTLCNQNFLFTFDDQTIDFFPQIPVHIEIFQSNTRNSRKEHRALETFFLFKQPHTLFFLVHIKILLSHTEILGKSLTTPEFFTFSSSRTQFFSLSTSKFSCHTHTRTNFLDNILSTPNFLPFQVAAHVFSKTRFFEDHIEFFGQIHEESRKYIDHTKLFAFLNIRTFFESSMPPTNFFSQTHGETQNTLST